MPIADVDDVAVPLLRSLTDQEAAYAATLLMWAETLIAAEAKRRGTELAALDRAAVTMVEAQAVARVLKNPDLARSESLAGEYSVTVDRIASDGVLRISPDEWALLFPADAPGGAFSVDTATGWVSPHLPWCNIYWNDADCSCGTNIAGRPIYETGAL